MVIFFFFNDTATTEIYTLSLHDALPIFERFLRQRGRRARACDQHRIGLGGHELERLARDRGIAARIGLGGGELEALDRKSTRLNSSHTVISYAVFCLKKKIENKIFNTCF